MEEKKKFEKPELKVVQLKTAPVMAGSCPAYCEDDCGDDCAPLD